MTNATKKLNRQTRNAFKKLDRGADNFFKKTIPNVARKVGGYIEQGANIIDDQVINPGLKKLDEAGDWVVDTSRKVGNTLEKYADPLISAGGALGAGALYATGFGAPLATGVLMGSQLAASRVGDAGRSIKNVSKQFDNIKDKTFDKVKAGYDTTKKTLNKEYSKARSGVNQAYADVRRGVNQTASQATRIANNTIADVRQAGLDLQNQAKTEYQRNMTALNSNVGMAKQMARDDIKNFVDRSKARANMAITRGSNALTDAINNAPNFV